ncbi:MAG: GAF domain-containing protein, partial [Bacteroidetes bacterium]|nr:GAF domain-containing protein [Bacteroidota bacterium]
MCHQKTKGNPYFIRKFLDEAFKKGYLTFDPGKGRWDASVEQIRLLEITDNVADLYANKLRGLHSDIQDIIAYAACIGQTFSESLLKKIVNRPPEETETVLWTAVQEGLLQVLDDTGQRLSGLKDFELHFRFMHEKLLSVAYERLDESSRKQIHLQIGRIMLQERSKDEIQEHIYSILGHFHKSFDLITDTDEKIQLANLFLSAGKKAKTSAAFGHAYFYMSTGLEMLGKNSWSNSYDLTIELYKETAHAAFLNGMYEKMNEYCSDALENVIDDLDKTNIYELIIQAYIHINELQEAINTGYRVLRSIGIKMPVRAGKFRTITGLLMTRLRLSGKPSEVLLALPEMQDPYKKAAVHILTIIGTTVYFSMPGVMPLIVFELIRLSVRYGNTPASPFAYAAYGLILCGVLGRVDEGYKYGQLALGLLDRPGNDEHRSKTLMVVNNFITHRRKNARETIEPLLEGYRCGIRTGDYEFASLNAVVFCMNSFCAGLPLEKLSEEIEELCTNIGRINIKNLSRLQIYRQLIANLTGECNNADDLNGKYYKEEELDNYIRVNNKTALAAAYALKTITGYFFSNYNAAVESANECRKYLDSAVGIMLVAEFHLFGALSCLAVYNDVNASGKRRIMYRVKKSLRVLKKWSEDAPTNYLAKYYIVEAEKARISGREGMMRSFLDKAINIAGQHGNLKESALAGELAGRFYHSSDNMKIAKTYLNEACDKYDAWGATALSGKLRRYYPGIIDSVTEADQDSVAVIADRLDTGTIIKASVALAETLQLTALLERLLNIAIENTGATKGILVLKNNGEYTIEASSIRERDGITVRQSVGFEKSDDLSHAIVQYVIHTKKHVLLRDASADTTFAHDRYVSGKKPKSVLCVPLIHNNDLAGLFYPENNLTTGAFTEERKEILTLLSSQIVISIENARFYEDLEQKVEQRTYEISEKNKEITDSIRYAKRIQDTILVTEKTIHEYLPYSFIFFQPRDIVSGDFYWFNQRYGQIHIAAVDCTGHGVPGAFLSMLAYNELGRIIDEHIQPSKILDQLNINIYKLLNRDNDFETANKEGMDILLCHIDMKRSRLQFAGAHQQLYHIR